MLTVSLQRGRRSFYCERHTLLLFDHRYLRNRYLCRWHPTMFKQEGSHDTKLQAFRISRKALPESVNNVGAGALPGERPRSPYESKGSLSSPLLHQSEEPTGYSNVNAQELDSRWLLRTKTGRQRVLSWLHPILQKPAGRTMLLFCFSLTFVVFFINLVVTLWAVSKSRVGHGLVAVYRGQCDTARHADVGIHLLINVFATGLLAASNHVMQQICPPSRSDVNRRHRLRRSFTIGSHDITNISGKRLWMCVLLSASSLPIHLLSVEFEPPSLFRKTHIYTGTIR